jgi:hypothetical protein
MVAFSISATFLAVAVALTIAVALLALALLALALLALALLALTLLALALLALALLALALLALALLALAIAVSVICHHDECCTRFWYRENSNPLTRNCSANGYITISVTMERSGRRKCWNSQKAYSRAGQQQKLAHASPSYFRLNQLIISFSYKV